MLSQADIQFHADRIRNVGYTVVERAVDPARVEGLKDALQRIEREHNLEPAKPRSKVSTRCASITC
jgi:hypothetical protein